MKKRRMVLLFAILLAVCVLMLWENGTISTFQNGLAFMMENSAYQISYSNIDSSTEAEIDLYNPESNAGKTIYDDGKCRIEIELVRHEEDGNYNIFFRTHGKYNRSGGTLVSSIKQIRNEDGTYSYKGAGRIRVIVGDKAYEGTVSALSGLNYKDGDEFGFYLFPLDCYEDGQFLLDNQIEHQNGMVKIQLSHLNKTTWIR